jgi:hypothetical protein
MKAASIREIGWRGSGRVGGDDGGSPTRLNPSGLSLRVEDSPRPGQNIWLRWRGLKSKAFSSRPAASVVVLGPRLDAKDPGYPAAELAYDRLAVEYRGPVSVAEAKDGQTQVAKR